MNRLVIALSLIFILALPCGVVSTRYKLYDLKDNANNVRVMNDFIENVTYNKQNSQFFIVTSTPTIQNIYNGNVYLMESGSQGSIIFRVNDNIYKLTATKIN